MNGHSSFGVRWALFGALASFAVGCGSDSGADAAGTGGFAGVSTGGSPGGSQAGSPSSGGATGSGGTKGNGGNVGANTGGSTPSTGAGGAIGSGGGNNAGSGNGGASSGGAGNGGNAGANGGNAGAGAGAAGMGGSAGSGNGGSAGNAGAGGNTGSCTTPPDPSPLAGWASVSGNSVSTTKGGEGGPTTTVTTLAALSSAVKGTDPQVVQIRGTIDGDLTIGSNKTLVGLCGAKIHGYISLNKSVNVIVRNLTIVGKNCTDNPSDCSGGNDAITVQGQAHHLWFDHDDVSDGSDGNLDMTHAADFITISWTKFHYSGRRTDPAGASGGHQFSNLIGHSDSNASEDTGHLRITFHHSWWADNVVERMPRARFGQVHLFNNLYTATGNDYCIGVGNGVNIRSENNVFIGVANPIKSYSTDGTGMIKSSGNVYQGTSGSNSDVGSGSVFAPTYTASLDATSGLEAAIRSGAGPH
jgi:pectate lyase